MTTLRQILPHEAELLNGTWDVGVRYAEAMGYYVDVPARWEARLDAYVELEQDDLYVTRSLDDVEAYLTRIGIPLDGWRAFHPDAVEDWTCDCDPRLEVARELGRDEPGRIPNLTHERQAQRLLAILELAQASRQSQEEIAAWLDSPDAAQGRQQIEELAHLVWRKKRRLP